MIVYPSVDRAVLAILAPLAAAILISGLDDLVVDLAWAWTWLKSRLRPAASLFPPGPRQLENAPRQRIAIFVPLWHEHQVIGRMLEHNLAAIRYPDYHFFAGCYPNDVETQEAVQAVAGAISAGPSGAVPASRSDLQGRLPELDLSAPAAARRKQRRAFSTS